MYCALKKYRVYPACVSLLAHGKIVLNAFEHKREHILINIKNAVGMFSGSAPARLIIVHRADTIKNSDTLLFGQIRY